MKTTALNLLISDKPDVERDSVADVFASAGGTVHRIARFWDPPAFDPATVRVYGADSFCLVLQQKLGFALCSPPDELLLRVPPDLLKRKISRSTLGGIAASSFPTFVKPVIPKQFRGAVYHSADKLAAECRGLPPDTPVFVAEPATLRAEARTFVLDGLVLNASIYEGQADAADAASFVQSLSKEVALPRAVVVDVGLIENRGWAVVEFNAAWGAGLNGCDPAKALPAILAASEPIA